MWEKTLKGWWSVREERCERCETAAHILSCEKANVSCSKITLVFKTQLHLMVSFKPWLTSHSSPSSFSLWKSGAADLTDTQHKGTWTTRWQKEKMQDGWVGGEVCKDNKDIFIWGVCMYACQGLCKYEAILWSLTCTECHCGGKHGNASVYFSLALYLFGLTNFSLKEQTFFVILCISIMLIPSDSCFLLLCPADCNSGGVLYCLCVACSVLNILSCLGVWTKKVTSNKGSNVGETEG